MNITISGQSGFIGSKLTEHFVRKGFKVNGIGRSDFSRGVHHLSALISKSDILINLAGAPIVKRWTRSYCNVLWDSRILTTRLLSDAIAEIPVSERPKAFFSTSAVDIYSNDETHTETENKLDDDFLGILCQRWEEEALRSRIYCRTYIIRTGVVLGNEGGALPKMVLPYKMFVGGKLGNGDQMISWIHIDDYVNALDFLIVKLPQQHIFNFTAPSPVSNARFSEVLANTLHRPNLFTVPGFALTLLYGEGATILLNGQTVLPKNLLDEGYIFQFADLEKALKNLLD
jgi:uncharacterized protein